MESGDPIYANKIRKRIYWEFGTTFVLVTLIILNYFKESNEVHQSLENLMHKNVYRISLLNDMRDTALRRMVILANLANTRDPFIADDYIMRHSSLASDFIEKRDAYQAFFTAESEDSDYQMLLNAARTSYNIQVELIEAYRSDRRTDFSAGVPKALASQQQLLDTIDSLIEIDESANVSRKPMRRTSTWI